MQSSWVRHNIALLLSPLGLLLISAVRLLIISDYNTTTATTVASSGGYVNTLLGTVIPLAPILMPYIALLFLIFRHFALSVLSFVAALAISPTRFTLGSAISETKSNWYDFQNWIGPHLDLIYVVAALLLVAVLILDLMSGSPGFISSALKLVWLLAVIVLIAPTVYYAYPFPRGGSYYTAVLRQPWLTAEAITLTSGKVYYGFTLASDQDWFTVLLLKSRTVAYIPTADIVNRSVCELLQNYPASAYPPMLKIVSAPTTQIAACPNRDVSLPRAVSRHSGSSPPAGVQAQPQQRPAPAGGHGQPARCNRRHQPRPGCRRPELGCGQRPGRRHRVLAPSTRRLQSRTRTNSDRARC